MMKQKYLLLFLTSVVNAQIGIATTSPKSSLDVAGDVVVRGEFRVGGTDLQKGSAGEKNQVLVSQGDGLPPVWKALSVPFLNGNQYKISSTSLQSDLIGIKTLTAGVVADGIHVNNYEDALSDTSKGRWVLISGLTSTLSVKNSKNRIIYKFQTGVEIKGYNLSKQESVDYSCGIFRNQKLVAIRPSRIQSIENTAKSGYNQDDYRLDYTESDVPTGNYTIHVACRKTETSSLYNRFSIGTNIISTNTLSNPSSLESILKTELIELAN